MNEFSKWFEVHPKLQISMMDHLYNRLDGAYPHKWRSNFPDQASIDNWATSWAETFEEERITLEEVAAGLKYCRKNLEWPPSIAEFVKACRPSINPLTAYYEAVAGCQARQRGEVGVWSHPAVYWASVPLSYDLLSQSYSQIKLRWEKSFEDQMNKGEWDEIKKPLVALPPPSKGKTSNHEAAKTLRDIGASEILTINKSDTAWYRKILDRVKKGDKTVTLRQRKVAEEAAKEHSYQA
jgi:hypothetical protein